MTTTRNRKLEWVLLLAALSVGWLLRSVDLELYRMSPDEGNYLYSAGIDRLEQSADLESGLSQDREWMFPRYYPHSFLHQLAIRWVWRTGATAVHSVRIDSAILGALTGLVIFLFASRALARRSWAAVLAGGIVALQCLHVWYARTGWGQTGCTFFFAIYLALGFELLYRDRHWTRDLALALAMGLASLLAYGWHEMIVVHVGGMGLFVLLHHVWGGNGFEGRGLRALPKTLLHSQKAWAALLSALPIIALFAFLLSNPFARRYWINFDEELRPGVALILEYLFTGTHIERQISWPVLFLAVIGFLELRRSDRFAARYLGTTVITSSLTFLLFYRDANLVRIYLPTAVVLAILAGNGLATLCGSVAEHRRQWLISVATLLLFSWMGAVSFRTIHDWQDGSEFLFEPRFHHVKGFEFVDARDVHAKSFETLRQSLKPGEVVGVEAVESSGARAAGEFSILFRLRDAGFSAEPFEPGRSGGPWPRFLMGVERGMEERSRTVENGGRYRKIGADSFGRMALYQLEQNREAGGNPRKGN